MSFSSRDDPDWSGRCTCSHTASHSAIAAITGSRKSFGCGLVKRIRSIPATASHARSSSPNSVRMSGTRSRPHELTFWPSSVISLTPCSARRCTSATISPGRRLCSRPRTEGTMQYEHFELQPIETWIHAWNERSRCIGSSDAKSRSSRPKRPRATPTPPAPSQDGALAGRRQLRCEAAVVEAEAAARDADPAGPQPVAEVRDRPRAERDVDERVALEDPLALRLGVAAADGDHAVGVLALPRRRLAEIRGELRVGLLPDRARVEDDDVGVAGGRRLPEPELLEHALDPLAVVSVHLAAEGRDVVAAHGSEA